MNTKRNNESQNKYEHLLDKYVDDAHADYRTRQEREEEARSKYGHLLDYAKPNHKIYEDIIKLDDMCRSVRQQKQIYRLISGCRNALSVRRGSNRSALTGIMLL